jgi:long-chain acyl-CoA synthetase
VNRLDDNDPLSAGLALDHVETRLSPEGELLVRSPSLMMGYWNDPEATAAALDDAGWLHTGDKASRLEARRVYLTGRLKEIIVTSTGRKVSPGEIEQRLLADPLIEQVMVVGEARPFLTALIVPAAGALEALRQELGLSPADDSASAREQVEALALKRCLARIRCCDVSSLLRGVALVAGPWSVANGLMTPTLKIKRNCVAKQFVGDIERLYSGHFQPARTDCSRNAGV